MQLNLNVVFSSGRYHGRRGENEIEWPPSPLRLFQALIAGSHRGVYGIVRTEARDRALRWLETLDPPVIEADRETITGTDLTNYVPNNDDLLHHVRTAKPMISNVLTGEGTVTYRWRLDDGTESKTNAPVVCALARLVTHLGQHQDTVHVRAEVAESQTTSPDAGSDRMVFEPKATIDGKWNAPAEGSLEACRARYRGVLNGESPFDHPIPSRGVHYQAADTICFDAPTALFELWHSENKRMDFDPSRLREPAAMTRNALIGWLKGNTSFREHFGEALTSRLIGGHEPDDPEKPYGGPHVAFVPIPSLHESGIADGRIRRVLVVGNGCEQGEARGLFADAVNSLNGLDLRDNGRAVGRLRRAASVESDSVLRLFLGRTTRGCVWRTVTPIVFSGMTRRGRPETRLVVRALTQAGIKESDIDSVATFKGPIVPKTLHALDYRVNGYLAQTPRFHAEVIFKRPVVGPLVVGRGRHSGFGLMMPFLSRAE